MNIPALFLALLIFTGGLTAGYFSYQVLGSDDEKSIELSNTFPALKPGEQNESLQRQAAPSPDVHDRIAELETLLKAEIDRREEIEAQLAKLELNVELIDNFNQSLAERPTENQPAPALRSAAQQQSGLNTDNLIRSGVDTDTANELVATWNRYQLEQLELRDTAAREGWLGNEEYREKARALGENQKSLREEIGDDKYDRYLYESGEPNRVAVSSVIAGSSAESIGLQSGDIISEYAGNRMFTGRELQNATRDGTRDETVSIQVLRDGQRIELNVPRGPLGIMLDVERVEP